MLKEPENNGTVKGAPKLLLRMEGALVFLAASFAYSQTHVGWLLFAILFFATDVFMVGYLQNARLGSIIYNIGHTYVVPAALFVGGWVLSWPLATAFALIWISHIGFDRALGYGLKYETGFKINHLGPF